MAVMARRTTTTPSGTGRGRGGGAGNGGDIDEDAEFEENIVDIYVTDEMRASFPTPEPRLKSLRDPFLLPNMEAAVERILAALERNPDVVLLPDEPYAFGSSDIDELKTSLPPALGRRIALISGRDLHWYGVHMVTGLATLSARLSKIRAAVT